VSPERKLAALEMAQRARLAARDLLRRDRRQIVLDAADQIERRSAEILAANEVDLSRAGAESAAFLDRLRLDRRRIQEMAAALREVAALPDPVGEVVETQTRPNGLRVERVRAPLGVVLMIYESRPNVSAAATPPSFAAGRKRCRPTRPSPPAFPRMPSSWSRPTARCWTSCSSSTSRSISASRAAAPR